jgi:hypothetical protein
MNGNEAKIYQNLWGTEKLVIGEEILVVNVYIKKQESS